jgi:glycosyltransferase involved in cell wall biosynthesis
LPNAPTDICMFVHNDVSSDARVLKEAASLAAHGWKVVVVGIGLTLKDLPARETVSGFTIIRVMPRLLHRAMPGTFGKLLRLATSLPQIFRRLHDANARVYHAHDFTGLLIMALAGIRQPIVYDSHELFFDRWSPDSRYVLKHLIWRLRPLEKFLARRAVGVITASDESADIMIQTVGIPRPLVLQNAVDLRNLGQQSATYMSGNRKQIVHSGGLFEKRHLSELVASLQYLPDDVAVTLMGEGRLKNSLLQQAEKLKVADRLLIVPPVPPANVVPTLAQADAAVVLVATQPLHYDTTLANKFFESIAAGLPIVSSPTTAAARVMSQYDLGVLCDPTDPQAIAAAIKTILLPENLARYRANAQKARADLNWEVEERKLIAFYEELLKSTI